MRFEPLEPRLVLSADVAPAFQIDYLVDVPLDDELESMLVAMATAESQSGAGWVRSAYGFTGEGQTVAVIDSGIAWDHAALGGDFGDDARVVGGYDFAEGDAIPYDDGPMGSHGTHVAGIIGADDAGHSGVAPGVDLVSLRVFDDDGSGYFSWVEQALRWVHDNRDAFRNPITAVNLSLGTDYNSSTPPGWAMLEDEFSLLYDDGIFISVAAGNGFANYNEPGLSYPAVSSYVVPVASVDPDGNLSYFSQRDVGVIAAPGRWITSTVPDYVGNLNGVTDDWASYSGTSMAAPYVAGASTLVREAMEFLGQTGITQTDIYDLLYQQGDLVYDAATGLTIHNINLQRALESLMPADDFGNSVSTAHYLWKLSDTASTSGLIGRLDDLDYFKFTAMESGQVTITADVSDSLLANWSLYAGQGTVSGSQGQVFTFDVVAGQNYYFALSTGDGLGYYTLDLQLTPETGFAYTDWGTVAYAEHSGASFASGEAWYRLAASRTALLTVAASFSNAAGNVDLEFFDAGMNLVASSRTQADTERIDISAAAGNVYYLKVLGNNPNVDFRLANLVSQSGTTVDVYGTSGDDAFTFTAGSTHQLSVGGLAYSFSSAQVGAIALHGGGGNDTARLYGNAEDELATLRPGTAELVGTSYRCDADSVEVVTVYGGGGLDRAFLYDSAGNDTLRATPTHAMLSGNGYSNDAQGFAQVHAYASGGNDSASLYDSAGDDLFEAQPGYATLSGSGYLNRAYGFDTVTAQASSGNDLATFYGSSGSDNFYGYSEHPTLVGPGYEFVARRFDRVDAYAEGGWDKAWLYGTDGDELFLGRSTSSVLHGDTFYLYASRFDCVKAIGCGGDDVALLYDSAGNDTFEAHPDSSRFSGMGFDNRTYGFDRVKAEATAGYDVAHLYDSAGDDTLRAYSTYAELYGTNFYYRATAFDEVFAHAGQGPTATTMQSPHGTYTLSLDPVGEMLPSTQGSASDTLARGLAATQEPGASLIRSTAGWQGGESNATLATERDVALAEHGSAALVKYNGVTLAAHRDAVFGLDHNSDGAYTRAPAGRLMRFSAWGADSDEPVALAGDAVFSRYGAAL